MFASSAFAAIPRKVPRTLRCRGYVPHSMTAAGVSGSRPRRTSSAQSLAKFFTGMKKTNVPFRPGARRSMLLSSLAGSSWPVISVTLPAKPRCVTGMPAYAGTAAPAVTPGTTSKGMPCSAR